MVEFINKEHFREALKKAKILGGKSKHSFKRSLATINRIKRNYNSKVIIGPDFVKHSFNWAIIKNDKCVYNGGMILHGFEETFSIRLCADNFPAWAIHT